jgi:amino acid transporter
MARSSTAPAWPALTPTSTALASGRLGTAAIVVFVWCAATPLTVVAGSTTTGFAATGMIGMPAAFLAVGAILIVFTVGFVAMARRIGTVGGLYAYLARGAGRAFGVGGGWLALLAYNAVQVSLYGGIGAAAEPLLVRWFDPVPPWWATALVCWALVAVLGVLKVDLNKRILACLLLAEVAVLVAYDVADLLNPAGGVVSVYAFSPTHLVASGVGATLALAFLGFVGFEATAAFASEAKDPARTIPRATYWSVALISVLYAVSSWAMIVAVGEGRIVAVSTADGVQVIFNLADAHLGRLAMNAGLLLFVTSMIAAMIAFHATITRYMFAGGQEGVLPRRLGRTWERTQAPRAASLVQSGFAFTVIVTFAVTGWEPVVHLFYWASTIGGVGVLLLVLATSVSVVCFFARHREAESAGRAYVAPAAAVVLLTVVTVLVFTNLDVLLNVRDGHPLIWIVRLGYPAALVLGTAYGLWLKAHRPAVYAAIGLGADAITAPPIPAPRTPAHSRDTRQEVTR